MGEDLVFVEATVQGCPTCKFWDVDSDQYPCCECGIRSHYSRNYPKGEAENEGEH